MGLILQSWRLQSFFEMKSRSSSEEVASLVAEEVVKVAEEYVEDDGWLSMLISFIRIATCFLVMMVTTSIWAVIMVVLLPWPYERVRQGNIYGHVTGRLLMWILGNSVKIEGMEHSEKRAIYISNHASPIDIFLIMWLTPTGTVGIAKKEIIWYPLFGQLYVLANHLRIDRSNPAAAIESMKQAACAVVSNRLSLIIFPEGTRSKSGRLLPFKKGFVHLALQTRLPIIPIIMTGTHNAWRKGGLHVRPAPITVKYLPPIKTENWTENRTAEYLSLVHNIYANNLPMSQKPLCSQFGQFPIQSMWDLLGTPRLTSYTKLVGSASIGWAAQPRSSVVTGKDSSSGGVDKGDGRNMVGLRCDNIENRPSVLKRTQRSAVTGKESSGGVDKGDGRNMVGVRCDKIENRLNVLRRVKRSVVTGKELSGGVVKGDGRVEGGRMMMGNGKLSWSKNDVDDSLELKLGI